MKVRFYVDNPVVSYIRPADENADTISLLLRFADWMKKYAEGYRWHPSYKNGWWDGRIPFYHADSGMILTGLIPYAYKALSPQAEIVFEDPHDQFKTTNLTVDPYLFEKHGFVLYDDQEFAINSLLKSKRGLGEICTGAGKTIMTCALLETIQPEHGLVIVPDINLVLQTYEEGFVACGLQDRTGLFYGSQKDELKQYTVATWQTLQNVPQMMTNFDAIIIDESHGAKGKVIQELMMYAENATYRYGITGTLPKNECDLLTIMGVTGPKLVEVTTSDLQKRNRLTNCTIVVVNLKYTDKTFVEKITREARMLKEAKPNQPGIGRKHILHELAVYEPRQKVIQKLVNKTHGLSMVLTNYTKEGKSIAKGVHNSAFMDGSSSPEERQRIREALNSNTLKCLVTSYQMGSTGLNYKALANVILASPTKSFVRTIQSIGRALRKHDSKDMALIFDINDQIDGIETINTRMKYYEEKGFPIKEISINVE